MVSCLPKDSRASGILLHVTSLPSAYGIGDMGPNAFAWIDRLVACGQSWWQILPLGPTGVGNSPYDPLSTFAGNPLLLSPDWLSDEGLIASGDCSDAGFSDAGFSDAAVDYGAVAEWKQRLVNIAWSNLQAGGHSELRSEFQQFCTQQNQWLNDYAHFRALKEHYGVAHYLDLPDALVRRDPAALAQSQRELAVAIDRCRFGQFLFFRQWARLKRYATQNGVRLIGDLPFFVSSDSADAWARPEMFLLDAQRRPSVVAGVPPDYFSLTGQLWGNPVYNWLALQQDGYRWWLDRVQSLLSQVDVIRLDHFRAFAAAWHVPADADTAESGVWSPGPGAAFMEHLQNSLGRLPFVAEDLGVITNDVHALRDRFQLPGMRILQFAFDGKPSNPFLPSDYPVNTVAYTGTHDNNTTRGWYRSLSETQQQIVWKSLHSSRLPTREVAWEFIRLIWSSHSALAIAPLQDVLNLGAESRMNVPGRRDGNWTWRCTPDMLAATPWQQLRALTEQTERLPNPMECRK